MRYLLSATAAGLFVLVFTAAASAQHYGSSHGTPRVQGHVQPVYPQNTYVQPQYTQAQYGGSYGYTTPSSGYYPSYGSSYVYPQSTYLPSYYPPRPISPWVNQYHPHHHHHGHR